MSTESLFWTQAARLQAEAAEALGRGDLDAAAALTKEALVLITRSQRQRNQASRASSTDTSTRTVSLREKAIAALTELNVPSAPKEIAAYIEARRGQHFDARALASIKRDEYRSWKSKSTRSTYLVPALEGAFFVASRGRLALSHWPLAQRIVAPLSARTDHLRACQAIAGVARTASDPSSRKRITDLLLRYTHSVPGAAVESSATDSGTSVERVISAISAELELIEAEDRRLREREAERAARVLTEEQQLWGGELPRALKGTEI